MRLFLSTLKSSSSVSFLVRGPDCKKTRTFVVERFKPTTKEKITLLYFQTYRVRLFIVLVSVTDKPKEKDLR